MTCWPSRVSDNQRCKRRRLTSTNWSGRHLADFQPETEGRNIVWTIQALPAVRADRALLRLVLVNLISNAVKFTGARNEARIEIGCAPVGNDDTVIFIRDNGAGFDPKY